jgi:hypothetical protein
MMQHKDKIMHFTVSAAIFFCLAWLWGGFMATIGSLVWGFAKEYYDEYKGGQFDWLDILADVAGIAFANLIWTA